MRQFQDSITVKILDTLAESCIDILQENTDYIHMLAGETPYTSKNVQELASLATNVSDGAYLQIAHTLGLFKAKQPKAQLQVFNDLAPTAHQNGDEITSNC